MQCFYTMRSRKILYKIDIFSLCFHMSSEFHDKSEESNKSREGRRQRDKWEEEGGGGLLASLKTFLIFVGEAANLLVTNMFEGCIHCQIY